MRRGKDARQTPRDTGIEEIKRKHQGQRAEAKEMGGKPRHLNVIVAQGERCYQEAMASRVRPAEGPDR